MNYTVKPGDTLGNIAARFLGSSSRYMEIMAINPQITNPNLIHVGQVIRLPASASTSTAAVPISVASPLQSSSKPGLSKNNMLLLLVAAAGLAALYFFTNKKNLA